MPRPTLYQIELDEECPSCVVPLAMSLITFETRCPKCDLRVSRHAEPDDSTPF